jgi:hypothetical protein
MKLPQNFLCLMNVAGRGYARKAIEYILYLPAAKAWAQA